MKKVLSKKQKGVTIIELILVMAMVGILTGVVVAVINPVKQKEAAEDGVLRANIVKACAAVETYYEAENEVYPEEGTANDPLDVSASTSGVAAFYIKKWPVGFVYNRNVSGNAFSIHVAQVGTSNFFKCNSSWKNTRECGSTTDLNDIEACDAL